MGRMRLFTIDNHGVGKFGSKNSPAVWIDLSEVDEDGGMGWQTTARLFLTPGAMESALKQLVGIGWEGDDVTALADPGPSSEDPDRTCDLRGLRVRAEVKEVEYEGKVRDEIGWLNHPDKKGGGLSQFASDLDASEMKRIRMEAKARVKALRAGEVAAPKTKTKPEPTEAPLDDDDDLTF